MTTQAIKRWLGRLFAWWPWRKLPATDYAQTVSGGNKGTIQEPVWRPTVEGALPQPGITSVAVEHEDDETMLEGSRSLIEEHQKPIIESRQSSAEENTNATRTASQATSHGDMPAPSPTIEQRLAFMRYLAQRGLINEGFDEGRVPDQYKSK